MNRNTFKDKLYNLFDEDVDNLDFLGKINLIYDILIDYQKDNEDKRDVSNKRKKWTDEELRIILSDAPSKQNCMKYAILFKRGYGSIEQIYRWSTTQDQDLDDRRREDAFIKQIKRIAKELRLRG